MAMSLGRLLGWAFKSSNVLGTRNKSTAQICPYITQTGYTHMIGCMLVQICAHLCMQMVHGVHDQSHSCTLMSLCPICYFTLIPILTLKGRYQRTPDVERIYYMSVDSSHELAAFDGISRRTKMVHYPNGLLSI